MNSHIKCRICGQKVDVMKTGYVSGHNLRRKRRSPFVVCPASWTPLNPATIIDEVTACKTILEECQSQTAHWIKEAVKAKRRRAWPGLVCTAP